MGKKGQTRENTMGGRNYSYNRMKWKKDNAREAEMERGNAN